MIIHCPSSDGFAAKSFIAAFVFWDDQLSSPFGSICEHHADGARDVKRQILISIPRRAMHSIYVPSQLIFYCIVILLEEIIPLTVIAGVGIYFTVSLYNNLAKES